jgi:hypothetical protein
MLRSIPLFLLAFVSACGGNNDTGGNGNGTPDMSASGGMPGMCSVVSQDCASGQKCVPKVQGVNQTVVGSGCVSTGTVAEGQPCTQNPQGGLLNDNCVAGTVCDNTGGDSSLHCRKFCNATTACSSTSLKCAAVYTSVWGLCVPSCTPLGTDCPSGNDCSTTFDAVSSTANSGVFTCKMTGAGQVNASCSADSDCAANLACVGPKCLPVCDNAHQCPGSSGDAGMLSCGSYANFPTGAGVCG